MKIYNLEICYVNSYGFIEYKKFENVVYCCFRNFDISICVRNQLENIVISNVLEYKVKKVGNLNA